MVGMNNMGMGQVALITEDIYIYSKEISRPINFHISATIFQDCAHYEYFGRDMAF